MHHKLNPVRLLKLVCLLSAVSLAGCSSDDILSETTYEPYGGSQRYPITLANGPTTLNLATKGGSLQPSQVNAVIALARDASAAGLTPVTVSRPSGGGNSARVASDVARLLRQQGISQRLIKFKVHHANAHAPVKVTYTRAYAKTKPCGNWSVDASETATNRFGSNHGCAVQANIAAMIADPTEIEVPATTDMPNASIGVAAVKGAYGSPTEASGTTDSGAKPEADAGVSTGEGAN